MINTERPQSDRKKIDAKESLPSILGKFTRTTVIQKEMGDQEASWQAKKAGLDLVFSSRSDSHKYIPLKDLFGMDSCVGIKICSADERPQLAKKIEDSGRLRSLGIDGKNIAVLTIEELKGWLSFYELIEKNGIWQRLNHRALRGLCGLERTSIEDYNAFRIGIDNYLTSKNQYLKSFGVNEIKANDGHEDFDLTFTNGKGKYVPVVMNHVRKGEVLESNLLIRKKVLKKPTEVIGMVIRKPDEYIWQTWARANELEKRYGYCVPVVGPGQLSLWNKWDMEEPLKTYLPDTSVDLRELMDFLYLGEDNTNSGLLATSEYQLSLPTGMKDIGADIIFHKKIDNVQRKRAVINDVIGLDLRQWKKGNFAITPIANVGGIIVVPDNFTVEQMHEHAKKVLTEVNRPYWGDDVMLLFLNKPLFEEWKKRKTLFFSKDDIELKSLPPERRISYGYGVGTMKELVTTIYYRGPKIGDMQMTVKEVSPDSELINIADFGSVYKNVPPTDKDLDGRAGTAVGLQQGMENGELPLVPGIYHWRYLLLTAQQWPELYIKGSSRPEISFERAELARRVPFEELELALGSENAKKIVELGKKDIEFWYGNKDIQANIAVISHAHDDHAGNTPLLESPFVTTWITAAHLMALNSKAADWSRKPAFFSAVHEGYQPGKPYDGEWRQIFPLYFSPSDYLLSKNVTVKLYPTDHSIDGSAMVGFRSSRGNILYSGDLRGGESTNRSLELVAKDDYDILLWECTNPPDAPKSSVGVTEDIVFDNLVREFKSSNMDGKLIITISSPNNLRRLRTIVEASNYSGRFPYIGYQQADVINHIRMAMRNAPLDAYGRDVFSPEIGEDIGLFLKRMVRKKPWQKDLEYIATGKKLGTIDQWSITNSNSGENALLIVSPYDHLKKIIGGAKIDGLGVVYSGPYPYQDRDKKRLAAIRDFVDSRNGRFLADFKIFGLSGGKVEIFDDQANRFHSSGHFDFENNMEAIIKALGRKRKGKTVYFVHGEHPEKYAQFAKEWCRRKHIEGITFIGTLNHYDKDHPLERPGQVITL